MWCLQLKARNYAKAITRFFHAYLFDEDLEWKYN